ncbi:MAG: hypothetical protein ACWA5K_05340 [bacterium]
MNKHSVSVFVGLIFLALASSASENIGEITQESYVHDGAKYPPVFFVTNVEDEAFKSKLDSYKAFSALDDEAVGLPIGVRVVKLHERKLDGASVSSLMLSASTLGLTPVVSNKEFKVRYDVFVQGNSIYNVVYTMSTTEVESLYSNPGAERDLKPAEESFLESSIPQFLVDMKASEEVNEVFDEYVYYFGDSH